MVYCNQRGTNVLPGTRTTTTNLGGRHVPAGTRSSYRPSVGASRVSSVYNSHVVPGTRSHHTTTYVPTGNTRTYSIWSGGGGGTIAGILSISFVALLIFACLPILFI